MDKSNIIVLFNKLKQYCEDEGFKGWDPYDGLNSKVFRSLPFLKNSALCRLIVIQGFKRMPFNLRRLMMVPKEYNAKGIGLFLDGYCNLHDIVTQNPEAESAFGSKKSVVDRINELAELLISLRSEGYSGACWGYNFDWQARRLFLFPKGTPTVVATCFCATALFHAFEITGNTRYRDIALTSADFVVKDLHRTPYGDGFIFSYSPLPGNDTVFNASLLGSKLLSICYKYTGKEEYRILAEKSVKACMNGQRADGAWVYGMHAVQSWVDSFHTGYNLDGLTAYRQNTGDTSYDDAISRGFDYYINNMFESDGTPKYYDNRTYPIDIHCPGQLLVTLHHMGKYDDYKELAEKVIDWTIRNMSEKKGYFYYQLKKGISSKIPYMRWSNAFMFNALSCNLLDTLSK